MGKVIKYALLLILLYPILAILDRIEHTSLLESYHQFIINWWDWLLIGAITYVLLKDLKEVKWDLMENLRENQYFEEIARYQKTPYIPPIMLKYLLSPPHAFSTYLHKQVNNTFYRTVMNTFRDRVYIHADYNSPHPAPRKSYFTIVGMSNWINLFISLSLSIGWFSKVMLKNPELFLNSWERFTIPFVIWLAMRGVYQLQAISEMHYTKLDRELAASGHLNARYTWREAFPDQYLGQTIIRAWNAEKESRMRYAAQLSHSMVPLTTEGFLNSSFAPFPFPSETIPEWTMEIEQYFIEKQKQWNNSKNSTNVVPLRTKRRKI